MLTFHQQKFNKGSIIDQNCAEIIFAVALFLVVIALCYSVLAAQYFLFNFRVIISAEKQGEYMKTSDFSKHLFANYNS